jgi:fatty acid desaturase
MKPLSAPLEHIAVDSEHVPEGYAYEEQEQEQEQEQDDPLKVVRWLFRFSWLTVAALAVFVVMLLLNIADTWPIWSSLTLALLGFGTLVSTFGAVTSWNHPAAPSYMRVSCVVIASLCFAPFWLPTMIAIIVGSF